MNSKTIRTNIVKTGVFHNSPVPYNKKAICKCKYNYYFE